MTHLERAGILDLSGGWTRIAQSNYQDYIGVPIIVSQGATLSDLGNCPLTFTNNDEDIVVHGSMNVYYSNGAGSTLINQAPLIDGCYIAAAGGTLTYFGNTGTTDTFAVPVSVELGGTFAVTTLGAASGGKLIVQGVVPLSNNASVYMTDVGSSVQLSKGVTLECDNDYQQVGGELDTTDLTNCTLQDGPQKNPGTATISGGSIIIAAGTDGFGLMTINCSQLNFSGTYAPAVQGGSPTCDGLVVNGLMNILPGSYLQTTVIGTPLSGNKWGIIATDSMNLARFSGTNDNVTGLFDTPNQPFNGIYQLEKP